jgi:hypothetical protein
MNLTDTQKQQIADWIRAGAQLAEVQKRIESEFGLRPTYMEVKFLVSDLQVLPKDIAPPRPAPSPVGLTSPAGPGSPPGAAVAPPGPAAKKAEPEPPAGKGRIGIAVDKVTVPGAMVSGNVTFSDGKSAAWYIDQYGRLGLAPKDKGYRPPAAEVQEFQLLLEQELGRQGY